MRSWKFMAVLLLIASPALAQKKFSELTGPLTVKDVQNTKPLVVPYITWGGDVVEFYANGNSLETKQGSINQQFGLNLKLTNGDNFIQQTKDYVSGKTPFIRGTMRMLGQASEVLGKDPRTKPRVIMQLTYSLGDHIVARANLRNLNDLKGKKIKAALQQGGPHVGFFSDTLKTIGLTKDNIEIVWVNDLSGPNGPAALFRKDKSIDLCCVITPDMLGLCSGVDEVGSGAEGTIQGAHVINSTSVMSRSIADVWAVREDFYKSNKETVEKFVAAYMKAAEELIPERSGYDKTGRLTPKYKTTLEFAKKTFNKDAGEEIFLTIEEDVHGLLLDATFVGLTGNVSFFEDSGNLNGFSAKQKSALDLATGWGYASIRSGFNPSELDFKKIATLAGIEYKAPKIKQRIKAEAIDAFPDSMELDDRTIASFTINFIPNQETFSADSYGAEFARAIKQASDYGNAVILIRGHSDPTRTLANVVRSGVKLGIIKRSGTKGNYKYTLGGRSLDLNQTRKIITLIEEGLFDKVPEEISPSESMQSALNLSKARAEGVKKALQQYAKTQGFNLDISQIRPVGAGISEPIIAKPVDLTEAKKNMRVEFRIVKVAAEALEPSDFDF